MTLAVFQWRPSGSGSHMALLHMVRSCSPSACLHLPGHSWHVPHCQARETSRSWGTSPGRSRPQANSTPTVNAVSADAVLFLCLSVALPPHAYGLLWLTLGQLERLGRCMISEKGSVLYVSTGHAIAFTSRLSLFSTCTNACLPVARGSLSLCVRVRTANEGNVTCASTYGKLRPHSSTLR